MNKLIVAILTVLLLASVGISQSKSDSDAALKDRLIAIEKQSWEAWQKRDGKFFQDFLSDDHVEMGAAGVNTKASVVAFVGSPVCVVKSWSADKFQMTRFDANTAVLTYFAQQDTACGGKPVPSPVWVTSLYVLRGGKWLNALYEQTPAK